jgi:hypothetical protein
VKVVFSTETYTRLKLIADAEGLSTPVEAMNHVVRIASEKLYEKHAAEQAKLRAAAEKKAKEKASKPRRK